MARTETPVRERLPLLLTMLWVAGLPVFLLFGNRLPGAIPAFKADRLAYFLAAAPLVVTALRRPRLLQPPGRVEAAMTVYLVVILISWGTTLPHKRLPLFKQDADFLLTCFLMPFTAFVIARNMKWTRNRIIACLWWLVGGVGVYLLLCGTVQYTYDWNFLVPKAVQDIHPERARGPYVSAVVYGVVLSILVPISLFLYIRSRRRLARFALVAIAIGLVQGVVACKTRSVWLGLALALLPPSLHHPRVRLLSVLLLVGLAGQVVVAPIIGFDAWKLHQRLTQGEPVQDRIALAATATQMIQHKPLFGFGFGDSTFNEKKAGYYAAWGDVSPQSAVYPNNPHNDFLNVFVLMGVVGFIPYLALLGVSCLELWRQRRNPFASELASFVQPVFLILIVNGQFHSVMHMSYAQLLFFFLLGIVVRGPAEAVEAADVRRATGLAA